MVFRIPSGSSFYPEEEVEGAAVVSGCNRPRALWPENSLERFDLIIAVALGEGAVGPIGRVKLLSDGRNGIQE